MKKVLATVAVSTALIMGGAVAASAAGIEMEGSVRSRGLSEQRVAQDSAPYNTYDTTVRLGMKSMPSDNLTGYILLETGSTSGDTYTWGNESATTLTRGGTQAVGQLGLLQAWVNYKATPTISFKIGHQSVAPGTKQFVNHENSGDDAIFINYDPMASTHAHIALVKLSEGTTNDNSDDLDAYALVATHKFNDAFKMGVNYIYLKGSAEQSETGSGALFPGLALSNLGIDATYKMGALTLSGDVNLQFGEIGSDGTAAGTTDADGYAFQLGVDYKIDNSNVGLLFAQGSGYDEDATGNDKAGNAFVNFIGDSAYQVYIPGYRIVTPGSFSQKVLGETINSQGSNSGLSNLTLYQLNAKTATKCALTDKPLTIRGALSYMTTTEDVANYSGNREDKIGTELDIVAAWALTSNLTYQVEAAYLWTGDVYKTSATYAPEDIYFLRHGITMKF
ncbi:MAG: hypothetical protein A2520_05375 [Deltaproteobacteria bacterium RIFOXYD12_FULL_53_23]|nr:MAG: hypothetical protein A2520_05375 [Deltaproteobacteria bacterium RIFOXYD12_FULL_53_23]